MIKIGHHALQKCTFFGVLRKINTGKHQNNPNF